jgi:Protein phosphatase 2C
MTPSRPPSRASDSQPVEPWLLFTESVRGATHVHLGLPNQDSHGTATFEFAGRHGVTTAVADGHGNRRHFRSEFGSRFAVDAATSCVLRLFAGDGADWTTPEGAVEAKDRLIPEVISTWRSAVSEHVSSFPFTPEEESLRLFGDDPEIAYGSTLLLGVWTSGWLLCIQIGDGDIIAVQTDGTALVPVPSDPNIYGHRTTSLCQPDAFDSFRYGIVDSSPEPPVVLLLATDGYANSQVAESWQAKVGSDIENLLSANGSDRVGRELKSWVATCASENGSGDDTTVSLVIRNGASSRR